MKNLNISIIIASFIVFACTQNEEPSKEVQYMFVQNADNIKMNSEQLTLQKVSPTTIFFSDRPERIAGHMTTADFVGEWNEGENSFADNPPNAVLSVFSEDYISDIVLELKNPRLVGLNLVYDIILLDGEMQDSGGVCSVFIDPVGKPLSPTSVAGKNRRHDKKHGKKHKVHK
jgi:hypothetical protein